MTGNRLCKRKEMMGIGDYYRNEAKIAFCVFPSFLVEVQTMLATYVPRMRNSSLEIGIGGSSCHP